MTSRAWAFTINSWTCDDCASVSQMAVDAVYTIIGFEKGSKKQRHHIQGYVYFHQAHSLLRMKKYLPRAHLEIAKGTSSQNTDYCSKEGDVWKHGIMPSQGTISKDKLEDVMKNPYENFHLYNQYRRAYQELQRTQVKDHPRHIVFAEFDRRFEWAKASKTPVLFMSRLDEYNGEDVVFIDFLDAQDDKIIQWSEGYPPTLKRGYEIIKFDPSIVYMLYSSPREFECLEKYYSNYVN